MKPFFFVPALLLASLAQAAPTVWKIFPSMKAPNGRLAIAWGAESLADEEHGKDYLVNIAGSAPRIVATLARNETWPGGDRITVFAHDREADGMNGVAARWSPDSKLVAVADQSKKGTNALDLVTASGKTLPMLQKIEENASAFLAKKRAAEFAAARKDAIYTCSVRRISSTSLTVEVSVWVHAGEHQDFMDNVTLAYTILVKPDGVFLKGVSASQGKGN